MKVNGVEFSGLALTVYRKIQDPKTWTVLHEGGETELALNEEYGEPVVEIEGAKRVKVVSYTDVHKIEHLAISAFAPETPLPRLPELEVECKCGRLCTKEECTCGH